MLEKYDLIVYALVMLYTNEEIMKKFGENVKLYRKRAGLTQEQLAEKCDCSKQTISGTETGYSFPSSKVLFNISNALETPLMYLFNFGEDEYAGNKEVPSIVEQCMSKLNFEQKNLLLKILLFITETKH